MRVRIPPTAHRAAVSSLLHATLALHVALLGPSQSLAALDLFAPPTWVTTENGVELQRMSDANTKLKDKGAQKIFDAGMALATAGADEEEQKLDTYKLGKAEERFSQLIDEFAPNYAYGYTNRANVRVALKNYQGALEDYTRALELAPLATDAWVTLLNRGSTLGALGREQEALVDLEKSVTLSKSDRFALLGRAGIYHNLGNYVAASADYEAVLNKAPADVQPFWLRLALDLFETGRKTEALGYARRVAAKFDLEPETNLVVCSILWRDATPADREEALRRYNYLPVSSRERMEKVDFAERGWPPQAIANARRFLSDVRPADASAPSPHPGSAAATVPTPTPSAPSPSPTAAAAAAPAVPSSAAPSASQDEAAALRAKIEAMQRLLDEKTSAAQ